MTIFEVHPLVGVGLVRLGDSRAEVLQKLGVPGTTFKKTSHSKHPTDAWFKNGFQVFYAGKEPIVEYIELSADSGFAATLLGIEVFSVPALELVSEVQRHAVLDEKDPELGFSYIFPSLELSLWRPDLEEPDGRFFFTIGIGGPGYYSGKDAA